MSGRRFDKRYFGAAQATGPSFTPMREAKMVRPEHLQPLLCECGGAEFRSMVKMMGMGRSDHAAGIEVMSCRACGKARHPDSERIPLAVREHGKPIGCHDCGGETFEEGYRIFRISRFVIGTAQDRVELAPFYFCTACGSRFVPPPQREPAAEELPSDGRADHGPASAAIGPDGGAPPEAASEEQS